MFDLSIFKDTAFVRISTRCRWGIRRKGNKSKVSLQTDPNLQPEEKQRAEADALELISVAQETIIFPEYQELVSFQNRTKNAILDQYSGVCRRVKFLGGAHVTSLKPGPDKKSGLDIVRAAINEANDRLATEYIPKVVAAYPDRLALARRILDKVGQFNPRNYVGWNPRLEQFDFDLARREFEAGTFGLTLDYLPVSVPENLPPEAKAEAMRRLSEGLAESAEQLTWMPRFILKRAVDHLLERLQATTNGNGRQPKFYDSNITNLLDFIRTFPVKDVVNDQELAARLRQCEELVRSLGFDPKADADKIKAEIAQLRSDQGRKEFMAAKVAAFKDGLDDLLKEAPARLFDFSQVEADDDEKE